MIDIDTEEASIRIWTDIATTVVSDGIILASLNDVAKLNIGFNIEGEVTSTPTFKTNRELKEDYGLHLALNYGMDWNGDGIVKEWYEQSYAFSNYIVGMTGNEVVNMPLQTISNVHIISADENLLNAGCTIQITGMRAVVVKSIENAR